MKRILVMALGVLMLAGAATAQPYWTLLDALNAQEQWLDSLATLLSAPTPVSVAWNEIFSEVTLHDSTSYWWAGKRTYPLTGGACIDGAKAILLEFSWTTWQSGGTNAFTLWNVFSPTATDTSCVTAINDTAMPDSMDCGDSTGVWKGQDIKNVNGTATILIPIPAGAGHHFVRMQPHVKTMAIYKLNLRSRIVW